MGLSPVGAKCPLISSPGELLGHWDWLWCPGLSLMLVSIALPFAFHIWVCLLTLLHQPSDFIRLLFTVTVSAPHHQPYSRLGTGTMVIEYPKKLRYYGGGVNIILKDSKVQEMFSTSIYLWDYSVRQNPIPLQMN